MLCCSYGYCGNDVLDGNIGIFSIGKTVKITEKPKVEIKKGKRFDDKFYDYCNNQIIAEFEID